jgi:hypothetical protein
VLVPGKERNIIKKTYSESMLEFPNVVVCWLSLSLVELWHHLTNTCKEEQSWKGSNFKMKINFITWKINLDSFVAVIMNLFLVPERKWGTIIFVCVRPSSVLRGVRPLSVPRVFFANSG